MKVAVCDDNREFCEKERTTIKDVFKQYFQGEDCQVDIYNDGQTIISNYSDNAYDMVFLDLELGDENGFDIAEQIVLMNNDAIINLLHLMRIWFMKLQIQTAWVYS